MGGIPVHIGWVGTRPSLKVPSNQTILGFFENFLGWLFLLVGDQMLYLTDGNQVCFPHLCVLWGLAAA